MRVLVCIGIVLAVGAAGMLLLFPKPAGGANPEPTVSEVEGLIYEIMVDEAWSRSAVRMSAFGCDQREISRQVRKTQELVADSIWDAYMEGGIHDAEVMARQTMMREILSTESRMIEAHGL